ncbi:hypothetical protein GLOTRDRAFT_140511 [Gloeophyllum trabeum ATCC 11539]|uniref:Uncharacterized protein n=1 Tax=Gloeophyllum trabeum (strain ATCC 11539 / FP-39264 / Madison 617) TaxID=670483 RepID=S7PXM3_GLOTA|nr:uncharacterized protein GLOTRDRAFT_140511 [Gloeophyllum trabeum ATCC 11539]EPQ52047.1 hypothetical protein GLOTRDRAFT_140511 [Gloeophyllum trabeum ATCC 11539]
MVASKTKKTAKYTYAERVLSALSHAQQEHRKHAVHHATLRAEVRKRAETKKDKLGPQWSSWVKRTVEKLEDKGAIEASGSNGNVALTPAAKKAIADARRQFAASSHADCPLLEDEVWRSVSEHFTRGTKRRKFAGGHDPVDSEDEVLSEVDDSFRGKRRRRSSGRRRPPSQMSRAELLQQLRNLQEAHSQAMNDLQSHTHDEETEESRRLREELRAKEQEIEAVRKELDEVKSASAAIGAAMHGDSISRAASPGPSFIPEPPRADTPPVSSVSAYRPRAMDGLVRTQSGSFISQLSKQPTPAPSTSGTPEPEPAYDSTSMTYDDEGDTLVPEPDEVSGLGKDGGNAKSLLTPEWSPRGMQEKAQMAVLAKLRATLDAEYQEKLAALDQVSESRASELRAVTSQLDLEKKATQAIMSERDQRIADLLAELSSEKELAASKDTTLASKDKEIASLHDNLASLEQSSAVLRLHEVELEKILAEKDKTISGLTQDKLSLTSELSAVLAELVGARDELNTKESEIATLSSRVHASEETITALRAETTDLAANKAELEQRLCEARDAHIREVHQNDAEISRYRQEVESLKIQVASLEASAIDMEQQLEASRGCVNSLQVDLSDANSSVQDLHTELTEKNDAIAALQASENILQEDVSALQSELSRSKIHMSELELTLDEMRARLQNGEEHSAALSREIEVTQKAKQQLMEAVEQLEAANTQRLLELDGKSSEIERLSTELAASQAREAELVSKIQEVELAKAADASRYEAEIVSLRFSLESTQREAKDLEAQLGVTRAARVKSESHVKELYADLDSTRSELEAATARSAAMEKDLGEATARIRELQDGLERAVAARRAEESKLATLVSGYNKLRKQQMDSYAEFDQTVAWVHAPEAEQRAGQIQ